MKAEQLSLPTGGSSRSQFFRLQGNKPVAVEDRPTGEVMIREERHDGVVVRTVFTGLAIGWDRDSNPLVFRTGVFGGRHQGEWSHYGTWNQAIAGHQRMVGAVWPSRRLDGSRKTEGGEARK